MDIMSIVIGVVAGTLVGLISFFTSKKLAASKITEAELQAKSIVLEAEKNAEKAAQSKKEEIREEWNGRKKDFEKQFHERKNKIENEEKQLRIREEKIEDKLELILKKEKSIQALDQELQEKNRKIADTQENVKRILNEQKEKLEQISGYSREEAKKILIDDMVNQAKADAVQRINQIREDSKLAAKKEAQNIIVTAIQRTASDHAVENTVSVVNLESDEMKGRIIGREGRNIRAFEAATGIDLIIDDTPEAVVISGFDPFRREVAKRSLEMLMQDGRIHPTRIEEVVNKVEKEIEDEIIKVGENTILDLGIHNMKQGLVQLVGKMKYRSSYGQNLLSHSIEVAHLCGIMAHELGLDVLRAKRAGLLHDVGKCAPKEMEGPHALVGMELAIKYKEHPIISNAIGAHHEDIEMESAIAVLVQAADSISGARPGARRESLEQYVKRLEKLEEIANSWDGVQKTYAIQAGRDLRVIVEPTKVDDLGADHMSDSIAKRIEEEMEYPGQITVTVIREKRSVSVAK